MARTFKDPVFRPLAESDRPTLGGVATSLDPVTGQYRIKVMRPRRGVVFDAEVNDDGRVPFVVQCRCVQVIEGFVPGR